MFLSTALVAPVAAAPCTKYITVDPVTAETSTPCTEYISLSSSTPIYSNVTVDPVDASTTPCTEVITLSSATATADPVTTADDSESTPCTEYISISASASATSAVAAPVNASTTYTAPSSTDAAASTTEAASTTDAASTVEASSAPATAVETGSLPTSFEWSSSGPLFSAESGSGIDGIKDPFVVFYDGAYHVFASTAQESGYNMVYITFADWADAGSAKFTYLDTTPIGSGYRAAPESLWYLVYQNGNAAYSTNADISDPSGWTAPKTFYSSQPALITSEAAGNAWVDMWVICDAADCHLFSSDDNGQLFRSSTSLADFPAGMGDPVVALEDSQYALFEASNVYSVGDGTYLLIVEAIGNDGNRYFRSWTSDSIAGTWTALAATESNPFARSSNVVFEGTAWTKSISHGEMVRTQVDQTLSISPCNLQYLYQGLDPSATGDYNTLPWSLGLLTQTNSAC
ncbi:hypothetical protein LTR53_014004 [Teratosphaeriaceae sp. CCFEE 6253]|nr:hypothetical protein LTR53_014004 [Teratosphaeriaceae sp. CCFEE 6253]